MAAPTFLFTDNHDYAFSRNDNRILLEITVENVRFVPICINLCVSLVIRSHSRIVASAITQKVVVQTVDTGYCGRILLETIVENVRFVLICINLCAHCIVCNQIHSRIAASAITQSKGNTMTTRAVQGHQCGRDSQAAFSEPPKCIIKNALIKRPYRQRRRVSRSLGLRILQRTNCNKE